jgi:hypothetical protein
MNAALTDVAIKGIGILTSDLLITSAEGGQEDSERRSS